MEIVSMEMKAQGMFVSRALSFHGAVSLEPFSAV